MISLFLFRDVTIAVSIVCIINDIPLPLSRCNHSCTQSECFWIQISLHLTLWSNFEGIPLNFHTPWLCRVCFPLRYAPVIHIGIPTIGIPTITLIFTLILIFIFGVSFEMNFLLAALVSTSLFG